MEKIIVGSKKVALAIKKVVAADGVNVSQNNGRAAGQIIFHTHMHVIPRFASDGYISWKSHREESKNEQLLRMTESLKEALEKK